jgi:transposase
MNKAVDEVRAGASRRMAGEGRMPLLQRSRWLLLKREENLKIEQRFRLRQLLGYHLRTVAAYLLKEALQQLWDTTRPPGRRSSLMSGADKRCISVSNR